MASRTFATSDLPTIEFERNTVWNLKVWISCVGQPFFATSCHFVDQCVVACAACMFVLKRSNVCQLTPRRVDKATIKMTMLNWRLQMHRAQANFIRWHNFISISHSLNSWYLTYSNSRVTISFNNNIAIDNTSPAVYTGDTISMRWLHISKHYPVQGKPKIYFWGDFPVLFN